MLTQAEADALLTMEKSFSVAVAIRLVPGRGEHRELLSPDRRERFYLDIYRGKTKLIRVTYQSRARKIVVLARLDLNGAPHTNPDGQLVTESHVHLYREGYEDRWAFPLPHESLRETSDLVGALHEFADFCHIVNLPPVQLRL